MTKQETVLLEKLREDIHAYHTAVIQLAARCEPCHEKLNELNLLIKGDPVHRNECPGIADEVKELKGSRKRMLLAMRGAWSLILLGLGALVSRFLGG